MKTLTSKLSVLALAALPLLGGCTQPERNASVPVTQQTMAESTPPAAPVLAEPVTKPEPAPGTPPQAPPLILQSAPALAEFSKLAQAGVDEGVMLSYVTNSTQLFNATADQIVYLNDLGVPGNVITAMMQHDQSLKQFWAGSATQSAPAAQTVAPVPATTETAAAAPTYVNPPQPETAVAAPSQPATVVNNNYFYDSLSPYGTWIEVEGYGRCWQPTVVVVNRGWRPYCDGGRWVYTDAGWYWLSDYSWGSTAFHYGRWFSHPRWGWCWWPDTVWASSWVSWRYSGDYCGWAPLPPHCGYRSGIGFTYYGRAVSASFDFGIGWAWFNYVPWGRVCDPRPRRYCAPTTQITQIHRNTTIINNYGSGRNNTVVNNGVTPARFREMAKHEIKPIQLREDHREIRNGRREQISPDGGTLTVNRPLVEDHRGNGRRDREPGMHNGASPVANFTPAPAVQPAITSPRATPSAPVASTPSVQPRSSSLPRGHDRIWETQNKERENTDHNNRPNRSNNQTATTPVTVAAPPVQTPSVQPHISEPVTGRQRVEERRNTTVQRQIPPTSATPVNTPNTRVTTPQSQQQPQASQPAPTANPTRVWSQPQQPVRVETQQQITPRNVERQQERAPGREAQQIRTVPMPAPTTPAAPRFTPQPQVSAPVVATPRIQTIESRPAPASAPARTESRGESRSESRKSNSSNTDSNNGRRNR